MTALTSLTIAEARAGLARKEFSAAELADAHIAAVEAARGLNAYVVETPERARAMAKQFRDQLEEEVNVADANKWKPTPEPTPTPSSEPPPATPAEPLLLRSALGPHLQNHAVGGSTC